MKTNANQEVIRSSFDIDGTRVELIFDEDKARFTVATRWVNLVHIPMTFDNQKWKRIAMDRASAVFEAVCLNGATKEVARIARKHASNIDRVFFVSSAGYEREVLRLTEKEAWRIS